MHIIIVSHERSGTHLTIDSIRNNFSEYQNSPVVNLDGISERHYQPISWETFEQALATGNSIFKTHYLPEIDHYTTDPAVGATLQRLFDTAKLIYVLRDGRDVMVSSYHYVQKVDSKAKALTFSQFLRTPVGHNIGMLQTDYQQLNRVDYWVKHINSWQTSEYGKRLLNIKFADWINHFEATLDRMSAHLECPRNAQAADTRANFSQQSFINKLGQKIHRKLFPKQAIHFTTVLPRKGIVGDHVNYFSQDDREYFEGKAHLVKLI